MSEKRDFDVILWGATGFTGRLVAEYLSSASSAAGLRWAIAGRNRDKLEALGRHLGSVEILVGEALDFESMCDLASRARVVCSTVGPYARFGTELVAACVQERTHYCDLAGEIPWIREMINSHQEAARTHGTRIVHCCGFDSIPSDLGVLMMHDAMRERGKGLARVDALFGESKGGFSGGTLASMIGVLDRAKRDPEYRRILLDPYNLDPRPRVGGADGPDTRSLSFDERFNRWTAPFIMAAINTRLVRRSNAVADYPYGRDFRYTERMSLPHGIKGFVMALLLTAGQISFVSAAGFAPLRRLLERWLPRPGEGPSEQQRESGYFVMRLVAESAGASPIRLFGRVADNRDPGYGSTSVMLAESAMCLARDDLNTLGGVLTPASAMGTTLIARLRAAGMAWEVAEAVI
ncbi:MAG: saccharopine dehydrogenase family protein [Gammaproteobacteria bacterium]